MTDLPQKVVKLYLREFISFRMNASRRIIDPKTGFQYEVQHDEVDFICPICETIHKAPAENDTEYYCRICKWRMMVVNSEMLALWHPSWVGRTSTAFCLDHPNDPLYVDDGSGNADPARADALYEESRQKWLKAEANNEPWLDTITGSVPGEGRKDDDPPTS